MKVARRTLVHLSSFARFVSEPGTQMYDSYTYLVARCFVARCSGSGRCGRWRSMSSRTAGRARRRSRSGSPGFLRGARETLELALYDIRLPGAPGDLVADELRAASARGVRVRLLYNVDSESPAGDPAAAEHQAGAAARAADRRPRRARDPGPDAPQVRGPRPRVGVDRLGQLDDRLVDAPGERGRRARLRAARGRLRRELRGALGPPRRGALRAGGPGPRSSSAAAARARRGSRPGTARELSQAIAKAIGVRAAAGADRLAGDHLGAGARDPGRARRARRGRRGRA